MGTGELWDLTDDRGRPVGRTHRRGIGEIPPGFFHIVSATCVYRPDGAVLITRRAAGKDYPLTWEFPAGSALAGETSVEAATRELREETGLSPDPARFRFVGRFPEPSALVDIYTAPFPDGSVLALDPEEVAEADWVTTDDVEHLRNLDAFAAPWLPRLDALWQPMKDAIGQGLR
ncbi:NUDIX hydrolase [Microbacterium paludicola]|uniref:NUDIX hydrolase n=1 Tax=Microbacterium paludicola TaxID=300019 RepID=A0A4Y9FZI9_9MICO|nr:NUDIX hydrolase [Microbacterium paludicola]MBF0815620.1 NUDIX hydrolase [Microbacterium paludicola]TFU33676.1 NUDIX hydrolase [Microbacterium paludicola]